MVTVLKNIIAPVQMWLLSRGQCVGCGAPISKGDQLKKNDGTTRFVCKCGRVYIYNQKIGKYRRALFSEV